MNDMSSAQMMRQQHAALEHLGDQKQLTGWVVYTMH